MKYSVNFMANGMTIKREIEAGTREEATTKVKEEAEGWGCRAFRVRVEPL